VSGNAQAFVIFVLLKNNLWGFCGIPHSNYSVNKKLQQYIEYSIKNNIKMYKNYTIMQKYIKTVKKHCFYPLQPRDNAPSPAPTPARPRLGGYFLPVYLGPAVERAINFIGRIGDG
jgi:hypothetical protein